MDAPKRRRIPHVVHYTDKSNQLSKPTPNSWKTTCGVNSDDVHYYNDNEVQRIIIASRPGRAIAYNDLWTSVHVFGPESGSLVWMSSNSDLRAMQYSVEYDNRRVRFSASLSNPGMVYFLLGLGRHMETLLPVEKADIFRYIIVYERK